MKQNRLKSICLAAIILLCTISSGGVFAAEEDAAAEVFAASTDAWAESVHITAESAEVGAVLTGICTFLEDDGTKAEASRFQWYRAERYDGDYEAISGATEQTYTVAETDKYLYIKFGVLPADDAAAAPQMSDNFVAAGNLAYQKSTLVSSDYDHKYPLAGSFDGDSTTYSYLKGGTADGTYHLGVDLETETTVNRVKVTDRQRRTATYRVQTSADGTDWQDVYVNEKNGLGREMTIDFPDVTARYIRLLMTCTGATASVQIREMEIYCLPPRLYPAVTGLTIGGKAAVGSVLTASFTCENGATEADSTVTWYACETNEPGSTGTVIGSGTSYRVSAKDLGKYIQYRVLPADGEGFIGEEAASGFTPAVVTPQPPSVSGVHIGGNAVVGQTVTAAYVYNGDLDEANTEYQWYSYSKSTNLEKQEALAATGKTLTIDDSLTGKYIRCAVTPTDTAGHKGTRQLSEAFGAVEPASSAASPCEVKTVRILGDSALVGSVLTGVYTYVDADGTEEGASSYQWYRSRERATGFQKINGATEKTYTITEEDSGCFLKFGVRPASEGESANSGQMTMSEDLVAVGNYAYRQTVHSYNTMNGSYPGTFALDGNPATYAYLWYTNVAPPWYVTVDLGHETLVNSVAMSANATKSFWVETSTDGTTWTQQYRQDTGFAANQIYKFAKPVSARYVRLNMIVSDSLFLYNFEVYYNKNTVPPVITVLGDNPVQVPLGSPYTDAGCTAEDDESGDITDSVITSGLPIDTNALGTYEVTYTAEDAYGNQAIAKRTVTVVSGVQTPGNLAFGAKTEASSEAENAPAQNAADGNPNTFWSPSAEDDAPYIVVDLGAVTPVSRLRFTESANGISGFTLFSSNNTSSWTKVFEGTDERDVDFDAVSGRYFKLSLTPEGTACVHEMELFLSDRGKAKLAADALDLKASLSHLTKDLALPSKGLYDSVIIWQSSDPAVLTNDGSIVRGETDQKVTLTAMVRVGESEAVRSFAVTVAKRESTSSGGNGGGGGGSSSGSVKGIKNVIVDETKIPNQNTEPASRFTDLAEAAWAKDYIEALADRGILSGVDEKHFLPNEAVTREQFVKMIAEAMQLSADSATTEFSDVRPEAWYAPYIAAAQKHGIIGGITEELFGVGAAVTRQDMCVILQRVLSAKGISATADGAEAFADASAIAPYAREAVGQMKALGIVNGLEDNTFAPLSYMSRAQAAKVLYLMLKQVG